MTTYVVSTTAQLAAAMRNVNAAKRGAHSWQEACLQLAQAISISVQSHAAAPAKHEQRKRFLNRNVYFAALDRLGIRQEELARRCGVQSNVISRIVTHKNAGGPRTMPMLAEALGVDVDDLFLAPTYRSSVDWGALSPATGIHEARLNVYSAGSSKRRRYAPIIPPEEE